MKLFIMMGIALLLVVKTNAEGKAISINLQTDDLSIRDTFIIKVFDPFNYVAPLNTTNYEAIATEGKCSFLLTDVSGTAYITLSKYKAGKYIYLFELFIAMPGEVIGIEISKENQLHFTGKSEEPYAAQYAINNEVSKWAITRRNVRKEKNIGSGKIDSAYLSRYPAQLANIFKYSYELYLFQLETLAKYRRSFSKEAFNTLHCNFTGAFEENRVRAFQLYFRNFPKDVSPTLKTNIQQELLKIYANRFKPSQQNISAAVVVRSKSYMAFLVNEALFAQTIYKRDGFQLIQEKHTGLVKEKVLTDYLLIKFADLKDNEKLYNEALATIKNKILRQVVFDLGNSLIKGKVAYNFKLPDQYDKIVELRDYFGKVVVLDFWFTGCGACKSYNKLHLSKVADQFRDSSNVVFISISTDLNKSTWLKSVSTNEYTAPHGVKLFTNGKGIYHPVLYKYNVSGYPTAVLIDKSGKIFTGSSSELRNGDSLLKNIHAALQQSQF